MASLRKCDGCEKIIPRFLGAPIPAADGNAPSDGRERAFKLFATTIECSGDLCIDCIVPVAKAIATACDELSGGKASKVWLTSLIEETERQRKEFDSEPTT